MASHSRRRSVHLFRRPIGSRNGLLLLIIRTLTHQCVGEQGPTAAVHDSLVVYSDVTPLDGDLHHHVGVGKLRFQRMRLLPTFSHCTMSETMHVSFASIQVTTRTPPPPLPTTRQRNTDHHGYHRCTAIRASVPTALKRKTGPR